MFRIGSVAVALLTFLASSLFATPTLEIIQGGGNDLVTNGRLDSNGNWVWKVFITPTAGASVAAEFGFELPDSSQLISASVNTTNFPFENPGAPIFGWETLEDVGVPEMLPVGLQINLAADQVFASLGSVIFEDSAPKEYLTIVAQGPSAAGGSFRLKTSLEWTGAYGVGENSGRIAETIDGVTNFFNSFKGLEVRVVKQADSNFDNSTDIGDFNLWRTAGVKNRWQDGDWNDDNSTDIGDVGIWKTADNGAGGGGIATPEPATFYVSLVGLVCLSLGRCRRL